MLLYGKYECFVMHVLYVCVHLVAVLNAAFCMTCSLIMLVGDARGDHMEEATIWKRRPYGRGTLQSLSHDCFIGSLYLNSVNDGASMKVSPFHAPIVLGETTDHTS